MSWSNNPYCQLADVKSALNLNTTANDAWITSLIPMAQKYLDREIGYSFQTDGTQVSPATRLYSGTDMEQMYIDDCTLVTQVIETNYNLIMGNNGMWTQANPSTLDITADVLLGPDNFSVSDSQVGYLLYRLSGLPFMRGRQNYKVLGVFGHPFIPADITYACIRLTCHYFKKRDTNYADTIAAQGGIRERYYKQVPPDVEEIIENYQRRLFLTR